MAPLGAYGKKAEPVNENTDIGIHLSFYYVILNDLTILH